MRDDPRYSIDHLLMDLLYVCRSWLRLALTLMVAVMVIAVTSDKTAPDPLPLYAQVDGPGIDGMAPLAVQPRAPPVI